MGKLIKIFLLFAFCVLSITPLKAEAARLALTGFEWGNSAEVKGLSGTASFVTTPVNPGGSVYALRSSPNTTGVGHVELGSFSATGVNANLSTGTPTIYVTMYFRYVTKPANADEEIIQFGAGTKFALRLNSGGNLAAYDSDLTLLATGTTVLAANTQYRLDISVGTGAAGAWEVLIAGVAEISGTGNLLATSNTRIFIGKATNRNGNTVDFFYDDVWVDNAAYKGAHVVVALHPNADGSTQQWTGGTGASDWQEVDETSPDSADYVQSVNQNDVALFNLQDSATSTAFSGTIHSVLALTRVRENVAGTSLYNLRLRSGTTNSDNSTLDPGTTAVTNGRYVDTDPDTSAAWTTDGIAAVEIGGVDTATNILRLETATLMVSFTPKKVTLKAPNNLGLVGYWSLNDGKGDFATDFSGNGNKGTLTGGPTWTNGKLGKALSFDGSNDYVDVGSSATLAPPNISVSFWTTNNVAPAQFDGLLAKTAPPTVWSTGWGFFYNSGTEIRFFIEGYGVNVAFATIAPMQWNHVVGTWDGATVRIFVNGVDGTSDLFSGTMTATNPMEIGRIGTDTYNINGLIDEVRIYNRALSTSTVQALYRSGLVKINASQNNRLAGGLVGMWSFNGADMNWATGQALDGSGQGNHGSLNGRMGTTTAPRIGKIGQALSFDGSDDYVNAGDNESLRPGTSPWTYSLWFWAANTNANGLLVTKRMTSSPFNQMTLRLGDCSTGALPSKRLQGTIIGTDSALDVWWYCTSSDVVDGNWHHIAFVRPSSGNAFIYVDGRSASLTQIRDSNTEPQNINNTQSVTIGQDNSQSLFFKGLIDEVRIYNRALSAGEVKILYNSGTLKIKP